MSERTMKLAENLEAMIKAAAGFFGRDRDLLGIVGPPYIRCLCDETESGELMFRGVPVKIVSDVGFYVYVMRLEDVRG